MDALQVSAFVVKKSARKNEFLVQKTVSLEQFTGFLGEKVKIGLVVCNGSMDSLRNVSIKAVIKSKRSETVVVDSDAIIADQVKAAEQIEDPLRQFAISSGPGKVKGFEMKSKGIKEFMIPITVADLGTYRLSVHLGYEVESGIGYRSEKNFKFEAVKAIKLNAVLHQIPRSQSMWVAELTVNNACQEQIVLEKATLQALPKFVSTNLNQAAK
jgi:hypothetical protein